MDNRPPKTPHSSSKAHASESVPSSSSTQDFIRESNLFLSRNTPVAPVAPMAGPSTTTPLRVRQATLWEGSNPPTPIPIGARQSARGLINVTVPPPPRRTVNEGPRPGPSQRSVNDDSLPGPSTSFRRSGPRQSQDYQEDADQVERSRDEADPDFFDSPTPPKSKKRKRNSSVSEPVPPPETTKAKKVSHHKPRAYDDCRGEVQQERDEHIRRIGENWSSDSTYWMPKGLRPSKRVKGGKGGSTFRILEPRDWDTALLAELAYLSSITCGDAARAHTALQDAVERQDRLGGGPQVLHTDIMHAIKMCRVDDGERSPDYVVSRKLALGLRHSKMQASVEDEDEDEGHLVAHQDSPIRHEEAVAQTSPLRSPTIAREDPPVKQEEVKIPLRTSIASNDSRDDWNYDSEVEKLREYQLRMEAKEAERDAKAAALEYHLQRIKMKQRIRERGGRSEDAIPL